MKLAADIGGTTMRVATGQRRGEAVELNQLQEISMVTVDALGPWLASYIDALPQRPQSCALAVAGPIVQHGTDTRVRMTNLPLEIRAQELAETLAMPVQIVNDFTAISLGLPLLPDDGRVCVASGKPVTGAALAVLGPGTGLGVSGLLPTASGYAVIAGEGGHVSLATGGGEDELAVLSELRRETDFVGAEDVLCGTHLPRLYRAVCRVEGRTPAYISAVDIARAALDRNDGPALETLRLFTLWLGRCAGDLALTLGARGGVYLAGGILPKWGEGFDHKLFTQGFRDKGRFSAYVTEIPIWLVTHPYPALLGLVGNEL